MPDYRNIEWKNTHTPLFLFFLARWRVQGEAFSPTRAKLSPGAWRQWHNSPCKVRAWFVWGWMAPLLSSLAHRSMAGGKFLRTPGKGLFLCKELFSLLGCSQCHGTQVSVSPAWLGPGWRCSGAKVCLPPPPLVPGVQHSPPWLQVSLLHPGLRASLRSHHRAVNLLDNNQG